MVNLTRALLLMAREARPHDAAMRDCDVCEVVAETVEQNRHLLSGQTRVRLDCPEHPLIPAEPMLLGIVVANLVRNAFNHTPSGQVTITVTAASLIVADTGTGIDSEEIGKVFQRHFKGPGSTGAGIGLSLVKRICDRYGWDIVITSADGQGTSARLSFAAPAAIIHS
jgi:signal transduction histidine kinase